jgi:hypothetical protein
LVKTLLQAERHDELLLWNSNKGPTGSKPLPEVHADTHNRKQKGAIQNGNPETSNVKNKRKRQNKPRGDKGKIVPSKVDNLKRTSIIKAMPKDAPLQRYQATPRLLLYLMTPLMTLTTCS